MSLAYFILTAFLISYPQGWSDDILISTDTSKIKDDPDIYIDSYNQVWVAWQYVVSSMHCEAYYTKLDSLGNCLIPETNLSNNSTNSIWPRILVDTADNVNFVWRDDSPMGVGLWYAKLANDGSVLIPPHLVVSGAGGSSNRFEMVLNKRQELNIAWGESPSGYDQITYSRLDNDGNPLIPRIQVSPAGFYAYYPGIGIDSFENYHFGYRNDTTGIPYRFMYTKIDKNCNFIIPQKVFGFTERPKIIADCTQNIHIIYWDIAWHIWYLKLDQAGNALVGPRRLSSYLYNGRPHMAMDSLYYLHVVWDLGGDSTGIMYCKLDTMGNFIIPPMKIVYPPPYGYLPRDPRIVVDKSNRLHLVWVDHRIGDQQIFYKRGENDIIGIGDFNNLRHYYNNDIVVFPNPFQSDVRINLNSGSKSGVTIFDISGRRIKEFKLIDTSISLHWNGRDEKGCPVPAGIYFIEIKTDNQTIWKNIIKVTSLRIMR